MSILAALDISDKFDVEINLYTFSSPNVGNSNFAIAVRDSCNTAIGIFNKNDIVPSIPQILLSEINNNMVLLNWDDNTDDDLDYYKIYRNLVLIDNNYF